uniref:Holin n=1 Tax=Pseudomonas phage HRDY3 TaxID=3236930 RepID=A0AB39CDM1_9VIRU
MEFLIKSIEKVIEVPLEDAVGYFFCTLCGVLISWIYKCRREGIKMGSYWLENVWASVGVISGAIAAFLLTIITEPGVGKITYLAIGMAADSMLNKPPLPLAVRTAMEKIEAAQNEMGNSGSVVVPPGVRRPDDTAAAVEHAAEKVGKNYVAGVPTGKADSDSVGG